MAIKMDKKLERIKKKKIESERFKGLIKYLYKSFPKYLYFDIVEKIINNEKSIKFLEDSNILVSRDVRAMDISEGRAVVPKDATVKGYFLGINALPLISAWKMEKFTKWLIGLTITLIIISLGMIGVMLK